MNAPPSDPPLGPPLGALRLELPAQPAALSRLGLMLAQDDLDWREAHQLIEGDMALAAALLKAANAPFFGVQGRIHSVQQALTYLGLRRVAALTYEIGLQAAFPPARVLQPLWARASRRALLMAQAAEALALPVWSAHAAGLFLECGQAVLFRHDPDRYHPLLALEDGPSRAAAEQTEFGIAHDWLGAALCETWHLHPDVAHLVRHQHTLAATGVLPPQAPLRGLAAVSLLVQALMGTLPPPLLPAEQPTEAAAPPSAFDRWLLRLAPQLDREPQALHAQLHEAIGDLQATTPLFR